MREVSVLNGVKNKIGHLSSQTTSSVFEKVYNVYDVCVMPILLILVS